MMIEETVPTIEGFLRLLETQLKEELSKSQPNHFEVVVLVGQLIRAGKNPPLAAHLHLQTSQNEIKKDFATVDIEGLIQDIYDTPPEEYAAFCNKLLELDEVLIVGDLIKDPRIDEEVPLMVDMIDAFPELWHDFVGFARTQQKLCENSQSSSSYKVWKTIVQTESVVLCRNGNEQSDEERIVSVQKVQDIIAKAEKRFQQQKGV